MYLKSATARPARRRLIRTVTALALAFALAALPTMSASAQSGNDSSGRQLTDFVDQLSVPGFDSSLGELVSAELSLSGRSDGRVLQITNLSGGNADFDVTTSVKLCADTSTALSSYWECASGVGPATVMFESIVVQESFTALRSGGTAFGQPGAAHEAHTVTVLDPNALAGFTDVDSVDFGVATLAGFEATGGGGNSTVVVETYSDVTLAVRYDYAALDIVALTNGEDGIEVDPGSEVEWTYDVTNIGTTTLRDVVVVDDVLGEICTIKTLFADQTERCTQTGIAADGHDNVGTATGSPGVNPAIVTSASDPTGHSVSAPAAPEPTAEPVATAAPTPDPAPAGPSNPAPTPESNPSTDPTPDGGSGNPTGGIPAIDIELHTNGIDADTATGPEYEPGDAIIWNYIVTNTGTVDLQEIVVTDDRHGGVCTAASLGVLESVSCTLEGSAGTGQHNRVGTVIGQTADGINVTDRDATHHIGLAPAGTVIDAPESPESAPGDPSATDPADEAAADEVLDVAISSPTAEGDEVLGTELAYTGSGDGPAAVALVLSGIGLISLCAGEALRRRSHGDFGE